MKRVVCVGNRRLEYTLIRASRRDVLFQALPEGAVRVYAPSYMGLRDIDAMVRQRMDQLAQMSREVDRRMALERENHPVSDGSVIMIEGKPFRLRLGAGPRVSGNVGQDTFELTLPHPDSDADVRAAIRSVLSARALVRIRQRLDYYIPRIGRRPGRIAIRDQKSRWGSCSSKGNLNFNWKLIMAPPQALDYVVIHELCHLWEFNHSPRFWDRVRSFMPDYEIWKKWLKVHSSNLSL